MDFVAHSIVAALSRLWDEKGFHHCQKIENYAIFFSRLEVPQPPGHYCRYIFPGIYGLAISSIFESRSKEPPCQYLSNNKGLHTFGYTMNGKGENDQPYPIYLLESFHEFIDRRVLFSLFSYHRY